MDAGGQASVSAGANLAYPAAEAIAAVHDVHCLTPSTDGDCDDLYGDVDLGYGFLPLGPPSPTSPPKTPSPGGSMVSTPSSSSPPPRRTTLPVVPEPDPEPEPEPKPLTPRHPPSPTPLPAPKPTPRHPPSPSPPPAPKPTPRHPPPPRCAASSSGGYATTPPTTTALYIAELPWWTTDVEVEAALAPHGALRDLHFFADRDSGRALGSCRADFLDPSAAASAAAALHGQAFHGRPCVASLSPPAAPHRAPGDGSHAASPPSPRKSTRRRGMNTSDVASFRGNVGRVLGDRPVLGPPFPRPMAPHPRPPPSGVMIGGGVGYGGFPPLGQFNARMVTGSLMPSMAVAPHASPAFLAAPMATGGAGLWPGQGMAGGLWGGHQPWHFGGLVMPRVQHQQAQQQHRNWGYGNECGKRRERTGGRPDGWEIGNVRGRGNPQRRQFGHHGGDWSKEHDPKEKGQHRDRATENERARERHCNGRDRHGGGDQRRYQECTEHDGYERREWARSWSHSSDSDDDDHPRRKRC